MRLSTASTALAVIVAGCAVGPSPDVRPAPVSAPVAISAAEPERAFLDSLVTASTLAANATPLSTATDIGWLEALRDSQLVALVKLAIANNRDLQIAAARLREAEANRRAALGFLLPSVSANASAANQKLLFGTTAIGPFDAMAANVTASWEFDILGRARRGYQAVNYDLQSTAQFRRAVELSLIAAVANAYLELRELDEDLRIAERTLESRQTTLRAARARFQQGLISELDVRQFESEAATAASRVAEFTLGRAQQQNFLSVLLGQGPGEIPRGAPLMEAVQAVSVPDTLPGSLLLGRPDVMGARYDWSSALARLGVAEGARLPRFIVSGLYGSQASTFNGLFASGTDVYTIQVGVSVPVFTGGTLSGLQAAARARADQARLAYERTVLNSMREASDALAAVRLTRDALASQESQVRALRRAVELAERRYQSGVSSNLEVLDVERGLFAAELALAQIERRYLESTVQLYKVIGGSWTQ